MIIAIGWILVAAFCRMIERTWWGPGGVLSMVMTVSAVGTVFFAPEYYNSPSANLFLQFLAVATSVGGALGSRVGFRRPDPSALVITRARGYFLLFGLISSFIAFYATLKAAGFGLADVAEIDSFATNVQAATLERYNEGLNFPIEYNIGNAFTLAYAAVMTTHFVGTRRIHVSLLLPLVIYCASNLLITSRSPILMLMIVIVLSAVYAEMLNSKNRSMPQLLTKRHVVAGVVVVLVTILVFYYFQTLRFGPESTRSSSEVWAHLRRWPWGSLPGFSLWYDGVAFRSEADMPAGFYTFMGIFDNLGVADRIAGGYTQYIYLTGTEPGNIYTAFRGLVSDFGVFGSLSFMLVIGFLGGLALSSRVFSSRVGLAMYVSVVGFCAYSFVFSFWAYTSNLVAMIVLPFIYRMFSSPAAESVGELRDQTVAESSLRDAG